MNNNRFTDNLQQVSYELYKKKSMKKEKQVIPKYQINIILFHQGNKKASGYVSN